MPCYDPRNDASYVEEHELKPLRKKLARVEAMLCAIMTVLEGAVGVYTRGEALDIVLKSVDYNEAGVSRVRFEDWFKNHKLEDQQRRKREAADQAAYRKRKIGQLSALANELGVTLPKGLK